MPHAMSTSREMRRKGYLLAAEAARKIGVHPQTLYRWVDKKKIDGFTKGQYRRLVKWSSVLKHLGPDACDALKLDQDSIWDGYASEDAA